MIYDKKSRKKLIKVLFFIIKLDIFLIPLFFLLQMDFSYEPLQDFLANAVSSTLNFLGYVATLNGHYISTAFGKSITIIDISMDCTGWKSAYALVALAIATPFAWSKRLNFLLASIPTILFINYVRIVSTIIYAQIFGQHYIDIVHNIFWQEGLVLAVLILWIFWLWRAKKRAKTINPLGRKYNI